MSVCVVCLSVVAVSVSWCVTVLFVCPRTNALYTHSTFLYKKKMFCFWCVSVPLPASLSLYVCVCVCVYVSVLSLSLYVCVWGGGVSVPYYYTNNVINKRTNTRQHCTLPSVVCRVCVECQVQELRHKSSVCVCVYTYLYIFCLCTHTHTHTHKHTHTHTKPAHTHIHIRGGHTRVQVRQESRVGDLRQGVV